MKLLFIILIAFSTDAIAGNEERARLLFEQGVRAAERGKWEEALSAFERSAKLKPRASTEFNIGSTLLKLDRGPDAIGHFRRYLQISDPKKDHSLRVEAQRILEQLEARAEQAPADDFTETSTEAPAKAEAIPPPIIPPVIQPIEPIEPVEPSDTFWSSPTFIVVLVSAVVVAGAIGVGFAVGSGERDPYAGSRGVVLKGLSADEPR